MRKLLVSILGIAVLGVAAVAVYVHLFCAKPQVEALQPVASIMGNLIERGGQLGTAAANAVLDASGVKQALNDDLTARASRIADELGVPQELVDAGIETLAIPDWQVVQLPEDAQPAATVPFDYEGIEGSVTLYDDPAYATVTAYGQTLTLAVPESAQTYTSLLGYLG